MKVTIIITRNENQDIIQMLNISKNNGNHFLKIRDIAGKKGTAMIT